MLVSVVLSSHAIRSRAIEDCIGLGLVIDNLVVNSVWECCTTKAWGTLRF